MRLSKRFRALIRRIIIEFRYFPFYFSDLFANSPNPLPPVRLRYRVGADFDADTFFKKGKRIAGDLLAGISSAGLVSNQFRSILDFGCGCGRVLGFLQKTIPQAAWHGADIDPAAVSWMKKKYPGITFNQNPFHPPSPFQDNQFDFIYGVSVFTHLDDKFQDEWLSELHRITKEKGLLLLSIHGETCFPPDIAEFRQKGFVFRMFETGLYKLDGLPDFYQTAWHTQEYIRAHWSRWFEVVDIKTKGINNHQDLVILRRTKK